MKMTLQGDKNNNELRGGCEKMAFGNDEAS